MALSAGRMMMYFLGVILVVLALGIFFFSTGLDRWVPVSLLAAGVLLIIGLAVMSFADSAPPEHSHTSSHGHGHGDEEGGDVTVVNK
jgi:multisubunit Na+/H+ antiporter MnhB subunit